MRISLERTKILSWVPKGPETEIDFAGDTQQLTYHSRETEVGIWRVELATATKRRLLKTE
jgi:hypothetical protein